MDLPYDRISLCKVPRASKFVERSRSGRDRSNVQIRDVIRVLQSDWPLARQDLGARIQNGISSLPDPPSPRVYAERSKRCGGERSGFETKCPHTGRHP